MSISALEIKESEFLSDNLIRLTQQTGDNEANVEELSLWFCKREIPKKGGKEHNSADRSSELIYVDLENFTKQPHAFSYVGMQIELMCGDFKNGGMRYNLE